MICPAQGKEAYSISTLSSRTTPSYVWDDTLLMTVLFLSKAGQLFFREDYQEEAVYQTLLHAKYLVDSPTGLWYHAWCFDHGDNYAGALWGRGNAWVTVSCRSSLRPCRKARLKLCPACLLWAS